MIGETVGKCNCGLDIIETEEGFVCESEVGVIPEDKTVLEHEHLDKDFLYRWGGCDLDTMDAKALFRGQTISVQLKSKKGNFYRVQMGYNKSKHRPEILWGRWG